ncbi:hypothetical protein MMC26_002794 [Xylographa opegraphella]|nr:hypothetical protein [Xylographa opegraphella]
MAFDRTHTLASQMPAEDITPQNDCPLFKKIPPEIRHLIFEFALTAVPGIPYAKGTYYDRPGYHYSHRVKIDLLLTCRLVYSECSLLPVKLNEILSWHDAGRGPPHYETCKNLTRPNTVEQIAISKVHYFAQQNWLERYWRLRATGTGSNYRAIHFTIRHTDWWDWEDGSELHLDPKQSGQARKPFRRENEPFAVESWGNVFRNLHGVEQFVLELETVEAKEAELEEIVARAAGWRFPLGNGNTLVLDESRTVRSTWMGLNRFRGRPQGSIQSTDCALFPEPYQTPKLKPRIVEMAEDFLDKQENSLDIGPASPDTHELGSSARTAPGTSNLESARPTTIRLGDLPDPRVSKPMTANSARRIIAEVQKIRTFRPLKLVRIYKFVQTGLTNAEIKVLADRETEDMMALHYRVVALTWVAQPGTEADAML